MSAPGLPPGSPVGDEDWAKMKPYLARANLAFYAAEYLRGPLEAPFHGAFMTVEHHEAWADLVNEERLLCINAARGHGKSYLLTFAYPLWMAEKHPGSEGFIFSASQPQADMILAKIIAEVEDNPKLAHMLPPSGRGRKLWSSKQIQLANGSKIYARGYGTKVRGVHPLWIVLDDVLNDNDARSKAVREHNVEYFFSAIRPTLLPQGQIIVVGTPFHAQDLYGVLADKMEYHFEKFPAILDAGTTDERALWPEYFSLAALKKIQGEVGMVRFAREYSCEPTSDESSLFPTKLFMQPGIMQDHVRLGMPRRRFIDQCGVKTFFMGVDFGLSANVGSDYTVIWTMGVDAQGTRWIVEIQRERGLAFGEQKQWIIETARKYRPAVVYLESNQAQRIFGETLIAETDLPIMLHQTGEGKHSLDEGIPSLRLLLENGKIRVPRGDERSVELTDIWMDEMRSITFDGKISSTGAHDDTVHALYICNTAILKSSFTFSFDEQAGDAEAYEAEQQAMEAPSEEDAEALEELEEGSMYLGSKTHPGPPRIYNARLIDGAEGDEAESKRESELKPYREVMPKLGSPKVSDLFRR